MVSMDWLLRHRRTKGAETDRLIPKGAGANPLLYPEPPTIYVPGTQSHIFERSEILYPKSFNFSHYSVSFIIISQTYIPVNSSKELVSVN